MEDDRKKSTKDENAGWRGEGRSRVPGERTTGWNPPQDGSFSRKRDSESKHKFAKRVPEHSETEITPGRADRGESETFAKQRNREEANSEILSDAMPIEPEPSPPSLPKRPRREDK